jgi:hypothetical protein
MELYLNFPACHIVQLSVEKYVMKKYLSMHNIIATIKLCVGGLFSFITYSTSTMGMPHLKKL